MNYMEKLIPLLDMDNPNLKKMGDVTGEKIIEYYRNKGMLIELDASKDPEYTFEQLEKIIGSKND